MSLSELIGELFFKTLFKMLFGILIGFILWGVLAKIIGQEGNFNIVLLGACVLLCMLFRLLKARMHLQEIDGPTPLPRQDYDASAPRSYASRCGAALRRNGSEAHALTSVGSWNEHPSWSPDGRRLVYTASRNGNTDLYVLDVRTGRERRLTRTPEEELDPAWSPDNKWIAFSAPTIGSPSLAILVVRPDGSGRAKVTDGGNHKTNPAWSSDGKRILYEEELFLGHDSDVAALISSRKSRRFF